MRQNLVIGLLATALLAASASRAASLPATEPGARIAEQDCSTCHAVGLHGASRNGAAPPFRDLRLRYNTLSLERELARISTQGHLDMRPHPISDSDIASLAAYIQSLESPQR